MCQNDVDSVYLLIKLIVRSVLLGQLNTLTFLPYPLHVYMYVLYVYILHVPFTWICVNKLN